MEEKNCIFCQIANKHAAKELEYESENVVAFEDQKPQSERHILIVPKKHIHDFADSSPMDAPIWSEMITAAQNLIKKYSLDQKGYRVAINGTAAGRVHHMHWHLLGGVDQNRPL